MILLQNNKNIAYAKCPSLIIISEFSINSPGKSIKELISALYLTLLLEDFSQLFCTLKKFLKECYRK